MSDTSVQRKTRIGLMTLTVDGRLAAGTAVVARKFIEILIQHCDKFDLTFIHYEKSDDPIYGHGVREVIIPKFRWRILNRRSLRFIHYVFTTKDDFDIVQWFQPRMYPFFWKLPAKYTVVFVHGAGDVAPGKPFVFSREILNKILIFFRRRINIAIAGSDFARKEIIKYYHFDPSQVRVVNNGVDESFIPASPNIIAETVKKYKLPRKYFLGVGRLIPVKNVLRSLEAFEEFCKETGNTEMYFVNIGARGSERPAIDAFLAASPYKDRIMLIDYVDQTDLPVMYSDAYALVFPLLNEGFGLPAIEAMACGIPAVISETAAPEITNDDAVLVDAEDMHDIARAMRALVEDSAFYERIKKAGQTKAATFTWKANGDKVIAIYEELMSGINTKK